jgi:hypothetical protein
MRLSVDVGGTFKALVVDGGDGRLELHKTSTTSPDPIDGILAVLEIAASGRSRTLREFLATSDTFIHGTTRGGGFGDPLGRDPKRIADDVRERWISPRRAVEVYGALLDANGEVDVAANRRRLVFRCRRLILSMMSSPARAGDPVTRSASIEMRVLGYWMPRFHPKSALADFGSY